MGSAQVFASASSARHCVGEVPARARQSRFMCAWSDQPQRSATSVSGIRPDDLAATVLTQLLERNPSLDPATIDDL